MHSVPRLMFSFALLLFFTHFASAQDFNVTFLHTPPVRAIKGKKLVISGNMVGADQVSIAALAYRTKGETEFKIRELKLVKGDLYQGEIPGKSVRLPAVEYFCYAVDFEGERHTVYASEKEPESVPVVKFVPPVKTVVKSNSGPAHSKTVQKKKQTSTKKSRSLSRGTGRPWHKVSLPTGNWQLVQRTPALTSVVTKSEIFAMGARTVADILDQLPGISVSRAVSGEFDVTMRGVQSAPEVLVLLDGHRINDLYSGVSFLEFPAEAIDRIEVVRGPNVSLSIPGAFIGVVNIITKKGAAPHASVTYGRFNEVRASAGGGWKSDSAQVGAQVQFVTSGGQDREVTQDALTGVLGTTKTSGDFVSNAPGPVDDHLMQLHAQLQGKLKNLGGGSLELVSHYLFEKRGAFVGKFDTLDTGSEIGAHVFNGDLSYKIKLGKIVRLDAKAYFDTHLMDRAFQVIPDGSSGNEYMAGDVNLKDGLRETERYQTLSSGAEVSTTLKLMNGNKLQVGVQFQYLSIPDFKQIRDAGSVACEPCEASSEGCLTIQGFELPCGEMDSLASGKDRMDMGFFVQDYWKDIFPGLDALAGLRLDYYTDFGLTFIPRAALVYKPIKKFRIKVMYSHAFRAPTFRELYDSVKFDPIRSFQGDDSLKPVQINTLEFGLDGQSKLAGFDVNLKGDFFINWIDDSIESVDQGTGLASWGNAESLFVMGTEVEGEARFGKRSRIFVNSSWQRTEIQVSGQPDVSYITDVPQLRFNMGMDIAILDFLNFHLGLRYGSERRNNVRHKLELLRPFTIPAYTLVRVGLTTEPILFDHLVLFAHAYNVFDYDYRDPPPRADRLPGYLPRAPCSFMAGIAWRP